MGLFRTGLMACLVVGSITFAQQPAGPGVPAPTPGVPDTNTPVAVPVIPQPEPTPGVDPNLVQPTPIPAPDATTATPGAATKPKAKKPAAAALPTLRGTVASIDKTNMAVVIHGKTKDETLSVTSKTRIFADNKPAILSDAKEGENVVAEYHNTKEKTKEALTLRFGGAGKSISSLPEAEREVKKPAIKPAKKKSTKAAAAKKKKNATPIDNSAPAPTDTGVTPIPTPDAGVPVPTPQPSAPPTPGLPGTPGTNS